MTTEDASPGLRLFEGFGVELEYMLVDADTLRVLPISDRVLCVDGRIENEVERGDISWSNELVLHVIELKTTEPSPTLQGLSSRFQRSTAELAALLEPHHARLLPSAMHPLMDPARETKLWSHDSQEIYETFDRIFDCRGHGWSNLQSVHLNLPFQGDEEFGRLHAAIRLLLPLLPALAASSPLQEGRLAPAKDARLLHYANNCRRLPIVTGRVTPEPLFDRASYEREVLAPIADAVAPFDTDGVLEAEWVNARGAIARFVRDSIEIRVIDVQEQPHADLGILQLAVFVLQGLVQRGATSFELQKSFTVDELDAIYQGTVREAGDARIGSERYLQALGIRAGAATAADVWRRLCDEASRAGVLGSDEASALDVILSRGALAKRILEAAGPSLNPADIVATYKALSQCLLDARSFLP
ncbi:MAG: glutamate-cysteine ligase family protein [Polyangiaceae bacterium]